MTAPLSNVLGDTSWSPQVLTTTTITHPFLFSRHTGDKGEVKGSLFCAAELGVQTRGVSNGDLHKNDDFAGEADPPRFSSPSAPCASNCHDTSHVDLGKRAQNGLWVFLFLAGSCAKR